MIKDDAEEGPKRQDPAETPQGACTDWSHLLEDYERLGSMRRVARFYKRKESAVREELVRQGVKIGPLMPDWSNLQADYERIGNMTRLAKCSPQRGW
jgi:hypothetical protein